MVINLLVVRNNYQQRQRDINININISDTCGFPP